MLGREMAKLLDAGSGGFHQAEQLFGPGYEIVDMDIDANRKPGIVHDLRDPLPPEHQGIYDVVLLSHVIEHIDRNWTNIVLKNLVAALRPGGDMFVLAPDMEWVANEIIAGRDSLAVQLTVFGSQDTEWEYHRCGYTLNSLALAMSMVGLQIVIMEKLPVKIRGGDKEYAARQIQVTGRKPK
jgi:SAM-dependent methyltransferase